MERAAASFGFDDLTVGQSCEFEVSVGGTEIDRFAALSGDASPLHVDPEFARRRGFDGRLAHGAYLVGLASRMVGMHLPGRNALLLKVQMSFGAPVGAGAEVKVTGTVEQLSPAVRAAIIGVRIVDAATLAPLARGRLTVGFTSEQGDG